MGLALCPLASGSSGNSTFVTNGNVNILIDAGLSGKRIQSLLNSVGADAKNLSAIFITHEHSDHISGAGILSRRFDLPVYATPGTWAAMDNPRSKSTYVGEIEKKNRKYIYYGEDFLLNGIVVHSFPIPHDASEPSGYTVMDGKHKIAVATDIGSVTDAVMENIYGADAMLIESNHDTDMLMQGNYPIYLKKRIAGDYGHLSNVNCGLMLREIMSSRLKHIYLGHLSDENNLPEIAFETVSAILSAGGVDLKDDVKLRVAGRYTASSVVQL